MATISLSWNTNMAAVTSCENALLRHLLALHRWQALCTNIPPSPIVAPQGCTPSLNTSPPPSSKQWT